MMTTQLVEAEVFLAVNEDGDWTVAVDESDAVTELAEEHGGNLVRVVKITVKVPAPVASEVVVTVPDEAGYVTEAKAS